MASSDQCLDEVGSTPIRQRPQGTDVLVGTPTISFHFQASKAWGEGGDVLPEHSSSKRKVVGYVQGPDGIIGYLSTRTNIH